MNVNMTRLATASGETVLSGARIVLPESVVDGHVVIRDGLIAEIGTGPTAVASEDLGGDYLLPGLVDIHTDHFEKHVYPRPHVRWDMMRAALAHDTQIIGAGVTTVFDSISVGSSDDNPHRAEILGPMIDALEEAQARGMLRAEHLVHLRCEISVEETPALTEAHVSRDIVRVMSVMEHVPGVRQSRDISHYLKRAMARTGETEAQTRIRMAEMIAQKGAVGARVRPQIVALAHQHGLPLMSHDDTEVGHIDEALAEGITISEFPCTIEAARKARAAGMTIVAGAPNVLRGGSQSGNVSVADLISEGLVDILASDYVPRSMLDAAFMVAFDGRFADDLPAAVAMVSLHAARAGGLTDRGAIAPGMRADLLQVGMFDTHPFVRQAWRSGVRVY